MKWIEAKVFFEQGNKPIATELVSNAFYDIGVKGVVVEGPEYEHEEGWIGKAEMPEKDSVAGYIPMNELAEKRRTELEKRLMEMEKNFQAGHRVIYRTIDEEDWAESWKEYFWPEKIGGNIVVKPTWREYTPRPGETVIEIDPGMAFGTGTHPTTAQCVGMIEKYTKPGNSFLDIGAGSGILMIAAAKFGAEKLCGVDSDETAVEIARENLERNGVKPERFDVWTGNLADGISDKFDMVTANILSEVIVVLLDEIANVLKPGGVFICSGIIEENREKVFDKMNETDLKVIDVSTRESWVSIAGTIKSAGSS